MTDERKKSYLQLGLPAITALVGVIIGALISGIFQLKSQELSLKKDLAVETAKGSRELQDTAVRLATDYLSSLFYFGAAEQNESATKDGIEKYLELQKRALNLSLVTSLPTSQKIFLMNSSIAELMKHKLGTQDRKAAQEKFAKDFSDVYIAIYGDIAKYRLRGTPESAKDELIYTWLQFLFTKPRDDHDSHNKPIQPTR